MESYILPILSDFHHHPLHLTAVTPDEHWEFSGKEGKQLMFYFYREMPKEVS